MPETRVALARFLVLIAASILPKESKQLFERLMYTSDNLKKIRQQQKKWRV